MREGPYDDIIHLPHHVSSRHPHMTTLNRAAQFSPFAALTGYEEEIREAGRLTEDRRELDENEKDMLDRKLRYIREHPDLCVTITWFVPDSKKEGGVYETRIGRVGKVDRCSVMMEDGTKIAIVDIAGIDLPGENI